MLAGSSSMTMAPSPRSAIAVLAVLALFLDQPRLTASAPSPPAASPSSGGHPTEPPPPPPPINPIVHICVCPPAASPGMNGTGPQDLPGWTATLLQCSPTAERQCALAALVSPAHPLHRAVALLNESAVRAAVEAPGADVNARVLNYTALHVALETTSTPYWHPYSNEASPGVGSMGRRCRLFGVTAGRGRWPSRCMCARQHSTRLCSTHLLWLKQLQGPWTRPVVDNMYHCTLRHEGDAARESVAASAA